MATYYINPSYAFDGDGTTQDAATSTGGVGAHNTWNAAGQITYATGNTYLGAGDVTWVGDVSITMGYVAAGLMTFGTYGAGRHVWDLSNTTAEKTVRVSGPGCVFDKLHIIGSPIGNGTTSHVIQTANFTGGMIVTNCILEIIDKTPAIVASALSTFGASWPLVFTDNIVRGTSRGLDWNSNVAPTPTDSCLVARNKIYDLVFDATEASNSDCIHIANSGNAGSFGYNGIIEDNWCYNWGENGIDAICAKMIIRNNELGPCLRTDVNASGQVALMVGSSASEAENGESGHVVYGNYIHDVLHPTAVGTAFLPRGAFDTYFFGNIIKNVDCATYTSYDWQRNNNVFNNVIDGVNGGSSDVCIRNQDQGGATGTTTMYVYNNIFLNITSTYLFKVQTNLTEMIIGNNLTDETYTNWTANGGIITDNGGSIVGDPLLDTDYYPQLDSPVIGAGAWTGRVLTDKGGRPFKRSRPAIGAWEVANRDPVNRSNRE